MAYSYVVLHISSLKFVKEMLTLHTDNPCTAQDRIPYQLLRMHTFY